MNKEILLDFPAGSVNLRIVFYVCGTYDVYGVDNSHYVSGEWTLDSKSNGIVFRDFEPNVNSFHEWAQMSDFIAQPVLQAIENRKIEQILFSDISETIT